jgi:hypothetical protein
MVTTLLQFTNDRLQPAQDPQDARTDNGKFGASKTFPAGCVLGRKTSDGLLYPTISVNAVQTITPDVAATGGTWTLSVLKTDGSIGTTTALAYNASIATIQTALDIASGVVNGVVASSAASAAPFSTPTALILTYSGTGFSALNQPLATVDISALVGTTAAPVAAVPPDRVWTITPTTAATGGHFVIGITRPDGIVGETGPIVYTASLATIQTALDLASGVANGVVASSAASAAPFTTPTALILTYSGTGFTGKPQPAPIVQVGGDVTGTTKITIDDTTYTEDGTEVPVGFNIFPFKTDANSQCFLTTGTAASDTVATGTATMPFYKSGTFKIADLPGWNDGMLAPLHAQKRNSTLVRVP